MKHIKLLAAKRPSLFLIAVALFVLSTEKAYPQGASINASGTPPDPSAMLDVQSTTKGFLPPRMSIAQRNAIVNPVAGLEIYNTDCNNFSYYNGTAWVDLNPIYASVTIEANPSGALCAGESVTFTATPVNGGSATYQWKKNGSNVGAGGTTYTTTSLNNGDVISCVMTSSITCIVSPTVTSNTITATVNPLPTASISYSGTPFCSGLDTASVSLSGTSGGSFSSTAGISLNATTGGFNPATSTPGSYTITYTIAASGGCAQVTTTAGVTITTQPSAAISYPGTPYCGNTTSATVSFSGTAGGAFSSSGGLSINSGTGTVNPSSSTPGSYTVSYIIAAAGGCSADTATAPITISAFVSGPQTFSYTGNQQIFTVPCGITTVTFDVYGAQGGSNASGGLGGEAGGSYTVTPGQLLYVYVGGDNGYNGGGQSNSVAGGGASDVRIGGTALTNRVVVAGGGGGNGDGCTGGAGGGNTGANGGTSGTGGGGGGGGQGGGGSGGSGCYSSGTSGQLGIGGTNSQASWGGGGGGYYGGGGGGYCNSPYGGGAGGGGSNYVTGLSGAIVNNQGVQSGNGKVIITY